MSLPGLRCANTWTSTVIDVRPVRDHFGIEAHHVADQHRLLEHERIHRDRRDASARASRRGYGARDVHLRHHPAAEDIAVLVGVRRHRHHAQRGLLVGQVACSFTGFTMIVPGFLPCSRSCRLLLGLVAQIAAQDLADVRFWQLAAKFDLARTFVAGELFATVRQQRSPRSVPDPSSRRTASPLRPTSRRVRRWRRIRARRDASRRPPRPRSDRR